MIFHINQYIHFLYLGKMSTIIKYIFFRKKKLRKSLKKIMCQQLFSNLQGKVIEKLF
jgi:hypothetical protein